MTSREALREQTWLIDKTFPLNIFHNTAEGRDVLYLHWHDNLEIIYMVSGEAVFDIGSRSFAAESGDLLFVNGGQLHSGYSIHNEGVEYYAIVFHRSLLASGLDPHHDRYIAPFLDGKLLFPNKVDRAGAFHPVLRGYVDRIVDEFRQQDAAYEIGIKANLQLLIAAVTRYGLHAENTDRRGGGSERFRPLLAHIERHYADKITVEDAAALVGLSSYHFCKTFKRATGKTFVEFLNLLRVNEAERLLKKTTLPVTHIAEQVGFCNINYFDKIFKRYKQYAPSQARKQSV